MTIPEIRGPLDMDKLPAELRAAVKTYLYQETRPDLLQRLIRGMKMLTQAGVTRIARKYSHVDKVYVGYTWDTLSTLNGILWWDDGSGETRRRILLLAWEKGAK